MQDTETITNKIKIWRRLKNQVIPTEDKTKTISNYTPFTTWEGNLLEDTQTYTRKIWTYRIELEKQLLRVDSLLSPKLTNIKKLK